MAKIRAYRNGHVKLQNHPSNTSYTSGAGINTWKSRTASAVRILALPNQGEGIIMASFPVTQKRRILEMNRRLVAMSPRPRWWRPLRARVPRTDC